MTIRRFVVPVTTAADGSAEAYSPKVNGLLHSINYTKTDFADGAVILITGETGGQTIWSETGVNATATRYPRAGTHSNAGVASLYVAAGTAVQTRIALNSERIKVVVTGGGNTKTGTFTFTVES